MRPPPLLSLFPKTTFESVYADGARALVGGTLAPKGQAAVEADGFRVSGQWPFASGCQHCDWLAVHCIVTEHGEPKMTDAGSPDLRLCLLPASELEILDTWNVAGLKGTGSHDIKADKVFVPPERATRVFGGTAQVDGAGFRIPVLTQFGMSLGACAVGIGRGALDEAIALAMTKRPAFKPGQRVAEDPLARYELGRADMLLTAATSLLHGQAVASQERADRNAPFTEIDRARPRASGWQATQFAREVVELAYAAGGGTSLYSTSPLQRRLRDVHAITQHAGVGRDVVGWLGGYLTGEAVPEARI